jgi:hypothetical protein
VALNRSSDKTASTDQSGIENIGPGFPVPNKGLSKNRVLKAVPINGSLRLFFNAAVTNGI